MGDDRRNYPRTEHADRLLTTPFPARTSRKPVNSLPGPAIIFSIGFDKFISCEKLLFSGA